jgi:hypothetical protein
MKGKKRRTMNRHTSVYLAEHTKSHEKRLRWKRKVLVRPWPSNPVYRVIVSPERAVHRAITTGLYNKVVVIIIFNIDLKSAVIRFVITIRFHRRWKNRW